MFHKHMFYFFTLTLTLKFDLLLKTSVYIWPRHGCFIVIAATGRVSLSTENSYPLSVP